MDKYAVIVAAGSGLRMGGAIPKQFLLLRKRPLLWYSIRAFLDAFNDIHIILVLPEEHMQMGEKIKQDIAKVSIKMVTGGQTRFHSVKRGLEHVPDPSIVFVHDGVRCLLRADLIRRCYQMAMEKGNAVPVISSTDSIRLEEKNGNRPVDRNKVKIIQTPQTFHSDVLKKSFEQDFQESFTDEAGVVENLGVAINLVEGDETNIKITRPIDLLIAETILSERGD